MTEISKKKSKKRDSKKRVTKIVHESTKEIKVERALIDNFISFQRVMVNLSVKFEDLSEQIRKLLEMFEIAAKSLAKKDLEPEENNKNMNLVMEKLDNISQQAGLIGKGLALMHETGSGKYEREPMEIKQIMGPPRTDLRMYKREPNPAIPKTGPEIRGYQKSIGSDSTESTTQLMNQKSSEEK